MVLPDAAECLGCPYADVLCLADRPVGAVGVQGPDLRTDQEPGVPSSGEAEGTLVCVSALARLVRSPPTVLVVANWVLAAQFALQAGELGLVEPWEPEPEAHINVPVQRPHGLHANATYSLASQTV